MLQKRRYVAEREAFVFVVGLLAVWDFEPTNGTQFQIPEKF